MRMEVCEDISSAELCSVSKMDCGAYVCVYSCLCVFEFLYNESGTLGVT